MLRSSDPLTGVVDADHLVIIEALEAGLPRIWADERAVRQVTLNLRSNAARRRDHYQGRLDPERRTIPLHRRHRARHSPRGNPDRLVVFRPRDAPQKNAEEGTGLGLPIVKGLVELQGGEFRLNSTVRLGTEVIVIFPSERVMDTLSA